MCVFNLPISSLAVLCSRLVCDLIHDHDQVSHDEASGGVKGFAPGWLIENRVGWIIHKLRAHVLFGHAPNLQIHGRIQRRDGRSRSNYSTFGRQKKTPRRPHRTPPFANKRTDSPIVSGVQLERWLSAIVHCFSVVCALGPSVEPRWWIANLERGIADPRGGWSAVALGMTLAFLRRHLETVLSLKRCGDESLPSD